MPEGTPPHDLTESVETATRLDGAPRAAVVPGLVAGEVVGRYVLLSELGQGGMGAVYAAFDPQLDRKVALKLLHAQGAAFFPEGEATARLQREAQALARLSHPNTVAVHDVGTHQGRVFIAMEFIDGQTLRAWLEEKPRPTPEVVRVMLQAGEGLAAIHAAGLVHRDFKAANVVVAKDGRVKVLDFGLARLSDGPEPEHPIGEAVPGAAAEGDSASGSAPSPPATPLTEEGSISGTPGYVAPELMEGRAASPAADQFAFGVALHQALYSKKPWASPNFQIYAADLRRGPPSAPPPEAKAPRWLFPIVRRTLSPRPEDRYPSMRKLLEALAEDPVRTLRLRALGLLAVGAAALVAAGGYRLVRGDCASAAVALEEVWPATAAGELTRAFLAARPDAAKQVTTALKLLDSRARGWAEQSHRVCVAASRRKASPLDAARLVCLKRRGEQLQILVDVLRQADPLVAAKSDELIEFFTNDLSCLDTSALNRLEPDDVPPEKAQLARRLRSELLRARALQSLERGTEGLALARKVLGRARAEGLKGFEGEALYRVAYLEAYLGEDAGATRDYRLSMHAALAGGVDDRALWAAVKLTGRLAREEGALAEAREMLRLCETLLARLGNDSRLELDVIDAREALLRADSRFEEMTSLNQRRLALTETAFGKRSKEYASAQVDLSWALYREGRLPESIEVELAATALLTELLGPDDPGLTSRYLSLGAGLGDLGRGSEARQTLQKGLALATRVLDPNDTTIADLMSALAWQLEGEDEDRALELASKAVARYERSTSPTDIADALLARARPLAAKGRGAAALADCERARELFVTRADPQHSVQRSIEMCRGRAWAALGKHREAATAWASARDITPPSRFPDARGQVALNLARALDALDAPAERVTALCAEAKAHFSVYPGLAPRVAEVDAFLDQRAARRVVRRR